MPFLIAPLLLLKLNVAVLCVEPELFVAEIETPPSVRMFESPLANTEVTVAPESATQEDVSTSVSSLAQFLYVCFWFSTVAVTAAPVYEIVGIVTLLIL